MNERLLLLVMVTVLGLNGFACVPKPGSAGPPRPPTIDTTGTEYTNTAASDTSSTDTAMTGTTATMSIDTTGTGAISTDTTGTGAMSTHTTGTTATMRTDTTGTSAMSTGTSGTTSTSGTSGPMTPDEQLAAEIDRRFRALNPGEILIHAPHEMKVGVTEQFVLRIASAGQKEGIDQNLPGNGQTATSIVHVTPVMRATLTGDGFTIEKTSPEEQIIGGGSYTEWLWQVTPNASGDRELVANVQVVLDNRVKAMPIARWPVHVSGNPSRSIRMFFASYWQWMASTLVIPVVLFFWRQRKKQS